MKLHIVGVCGTFMGGIARLAKESGHDVSGSDANTYPPMSTQLESLGINLFEGYRASNIPSDVDIVLVGNTISRGNPELESVLDNNLPYTSGAQWLSENILQSRWVIGVAGTHGKTTTASMVAWILEQCGYEPGFLIGGVPANFGESARLGKSDFFVIEADEYDTAFSDKRSKFIHYRPRTLILNNLEFDHADIFDDIGDIKKQFHHLLKTVPQQGLVLHNTEQAYLNDVIEMGCWSTLQTFGATGNQAWSANAITPDASEFCLSHGSANHTVKWPLIGRHNMLNATAAIAAAHHVGVPVDHAVEALGSFRSVKRRLEKIYTSAICCVYDDFAHHPTAIKETVNALRANVGTAPILAILEPRSNTMKLGVHKTELADSLAAADRVAIYADKHVKWDISSLNSDKVSAFDSTQTLIEYAIEQGKILRSKFSADVSLDDPTLHILIMSNGGFENLHQRLVTELTNSKLSR